MIGESYFMTIIPSYRKPGALVQVAECGDYSLWTYGRNGTGWAVFKRKPDGELSCVFNGAIGAVYDRWCELTTRPV